LLVAGPVRAALITSFFDKSSSDIFITSLFMFNARENIIVIISIFFQKC